MKNFGYVMATKMLVDNRRKVRFMYREEPPNKQDSGWRFFCGEEDQDYTNNPDNIAIYDINTIIAIDKSVTPYLNTAQGTALQRENENDLFTISHDFFFGEEAE
jgi:hypothetical protein